jgi:hypothetical protein
VKEVKGWRLLRKKMVLKFLEMESKAQTGIEFLIIASIAFLILSTFFILINAGVEDKNKEKETLLVRNLALSVVDEVNIAFESSNGYTRYFNIPETIIGKDFEISVVNNKSVYVVTDDNSVSMSIKQISGDVRKGDNKIQKLNETIYLNLGVE